MIKLDHVRYTAPLCKRLGVWSRVIWLEAHKSSFTLQRLAHQAGNMLWLCRGFRVTYVCMCEIYLLLVLNIYVYMYIRTTPTPHPHTVTHTQECYANPSERARFIRCIYNLLNSSSPAVRYEAAGTLVTLSSTQAAVKVCGCDPVTLAFKRRLSQTELKLCI